MKQFDVIVIGGGHAGSEAAAAAARMGAATALVTLRRDGIGVMSCNPAIGGLGKGHLVREIDAMDGVMGRIADKAGIQFRLLNRRKGPAVQGPRAQADRKIYRTSMLEELSATPNLHIVEGEVSRLVLDRNAVSGVLLASGESLAARSVILTAGTFLNGLIHIGDVSRPGGRVGDKPSVDLAAQLADLGLARGRLKTGTPPRLNGKTIRWDVLESQPGDDDPVLFSFLNARPEARQISCGITHTNEKTHDIIRANLKRSAMYGGHIEGVGPRYCPSIEDKVVRFADKTGHQVFLEPEGLDDDTVYPNGISTSLPADVQVEYVRSIVGLEQVEILQPGYAIEYDYFDPRELSPALQLRKLPGLFLAGQINGTTGYEEAAAQGLVAGLNAARHAQSAAPVLFERTESYIGVMIDDLVTRGVTEPYRMFTSRAEYRLVLRADNADQRLTPLGQSIGCVSENRLSAFSQKMDQLGQARDVLEKATFSPQELGQRGIVVSQDGARRSVLAVLSYPDVTQAHAVDLAPSFADFPAEIRNQVECDARYAPYLRRQEEDAEALRRDASVEIPEGFDFMALSGLSSELKGKLHRVQPRNLAHANRIEGMTPAALTLILALVRKAGKATALP